MMNKYRNDITGLRAIAIIPVLFYHTELAIFNGGYLGVDVFFVISGYLIARLLLNDLNNNNFSFKDFYFRRIKRLLPALYGVLLFTVFYTSIRFFPNDITNFSESLLYTTLFLSNIFFWRNINYFSDDIIFKPLAHTWSLGIEEQFLQLQLSFYFLVFSCQFLETFYITKQNFI